MKLENFISNCRQPRIIYRNGRSISVRCGRCPDCLASRSAYLTQMCVSEQRKSFATFFATLTYNEYNIPRAHVLRETRDDGRLRVTYIDKTSRPTKTRGFKLLPEYNTPLASFDVADPANFNDFIQKSSILPKYATNKQIQYYKTHEIVRYIRKNDIQNFFKRLRFRLSRLGYSPITFYACGEYGPDTFRPHFHILLHVYDSETSAIIEKFVRESWKLGTVRKFSAVTKPSDVSSYVAGYVNSFTHLPRYLRFDVLKPFSSHSVYYGTSTFAPLRDYLYENPDCSAFEHDVRLPEQTVHYFPTASLMRRIYPRCYNYDRQTDTDLLKIYTCFTKLSQTYNTDKCTDLSYYLLTDSDNFYNRTLLDLLDIGTPQQSPYYSLSTLSNNYSSLNIDLIPTPWDHFATLTESEIDESVSLSYQRKIFSRVYSTILMSKNFIEWNCQNYSPRTVLSLIKQHYQNHRLDQLRQQLEALQEYNLITCNDDYSLFYPASSTTDHYNSLLSSSSYIKHINHQKDVKYEKMIKHKQQNDANLIFV